MNTLDTGVGGATSPAKAQFIANAASRAYTGPSVVDYLDKSGYPSDPASRTNLASTYGVKGYNTGAGNGDLNTALLAALRGGSPTNENPPGTGGVATPAGGPMNLNDTGTTPSQDTPDSAYKTYLASLVDSPDVTSTRSYLRNLISSDKLAREKALNSGETMGFAGGEAARVGRNNALTIDAYTGVLKDLIDSQARTQDISKSKYEYLANKEKTAKADAKTLADETRLANPAFELSPGQERYTYNSKTGSYEKTAAVAPKPLSTTPKGTTKSGTLNYTAQDKTDDSQALNASKGPDGYVDPAIYLKLANAWVANGGLIKDFLATHPPKNYVNPANNTLPVYLRSTKPTAKQIQDGADDGVLFK